MELFHHLGRLECLGLDAVSDGPFHHLHEPGVVGATVEDDAMSLDSRNVGSPSK